MTMDTPLHPRNDIDIVYIYIYINIKGKRGFGNIEDCVDTSTRYLKTI